MRTCELCGTELPEGLRHGAKYCPHGRCKTRAYRARKKQDEGRSRATAEDDASIPDSALQQSASLAQPAPPAADSVCSLVCACGRQITLHIQVTHVLPQPELPAIETRVSPSGSTETAASVYDTSSEAAVSPPQEPAPAEPPLEPQKPADPATPLPVLPPSLDLSTLPPPSNVETSEHAPERLEGATELSAQTSAVSSQEVEVVLPASASSPMEAPPVPIAMEQPPATPRAGGLKTSSGSPEPPSLLPSGSFAADFWKLVQENPHEVLDRFQRLLSTARGRNDLPLVERAYCAMAFVHAIRGDEPRAQERLGQARVVAMRRGDTADVERAEAQIRVLLSGQALTQRSQE
jgi:hypothetical protein